MNPTATERLVAAMPHRVDVLRRDARGYPIPFVAAWSSHDNSPPAEKRAVLLPGVEWFGAIARSNDVPGEGHARLGRIDPGRAIRAHEHSLCNVCGHVVGDRLIFVGGAAEPQAYTEAPLHKECARYSLLVCPGLTVARFDPTKKLVVTTINRAEVEWGGQFLLSRDGGRSTVGFDAARLVEQVSGVAVLMAVVARTANRGRTVDSEDWLSWTA